MIPDPESHERGYRNPLPKGNRGVPECKGEGLLYDNIFADQFDEDVKAGEDQGFNFSFATFIEA